MTSTPQEASHDSNMDEGNYSHVLTPVFAGIDPAHPLYLECSCGDSFRVDLVGSQQEEGSGRSG